MGFKFSESIRYQLLIGKFSGMIYFPMNLQKDAKILDYICPVPFIVTNVVLVIYNSFAFYVSLQNLIFWFRLLEYISGAFAIFAHWALWLHFFIIRNDLKTLISTIDEFCSNKDVQKVQRSSREKLIYRNTLIFYFILDVLFASYANITYELIFGPTVFFLNFQMYFGYVIVDELKWHFRATNIYLQKIQRHKLVAVDLDVKFNQFKSKLDLIKECNRVLGLSIVINMAYILITLISLVCSFDDVLDSSEFGIMSVRIFHNSIVFAWFVTHIIKLVYFIKCWTNISDEVLGGKADHFLKQF